MVSGITAADRPLVDGDSVVHVRYPDLGIGKVSEIRPAPPQGCASLRVDWENGSHQFVIEELGAGKIHCLRPAS